MATASALTNTIVPSGIHAKEYFPDLLDVRFREIMERDWNEPKQGLDFYNSENTSRAYELYSALTQTGYIKRRRDANDVPMTEVIQGFDNTITPLEYALGIQYTRRMLETDQFGKINGLPAKLMKAVNRSIEKYAALPFNTTFDSVVDWVCADGMNLVDSARPNPDPEAATWSNLESSAALSQTSIDTMRLNFRKNLTERGAIAPIMMKDLVVPNDLESTAQVQLNTLKKTNTAVNDDSVLNTFGLNIKTWDYLTNSTAFFGMGPKDGDHELIWLWGSNPSSTRYDNGNPDVYSYRVRLVFQTGANRPHNIRGNAGA